MNELDRIFLEKSKKECSQCKGYKECINQGFQYEYDEDKGVLVSKICPVRETYFKQKKIENTLAASILPPMMKNMTFDNWVTNKNTEATEYALALAMGEKEKGMVLSGTCGIGKTHLASAVMNSFIKQNKNVVFISVPELLQEIKSTYNNNNSKSQQDIMTIVESTELLVLDDMGVGKYTEWVNEQIYLVLNHRYLHQKPTIVTTNYSVLQLANKLGGGIEGQRIISRISAMCEWFTMQGKDMRLSGPP